MIVTAHRCSATVCSRSVCTMCQRLVTWFRSRSCSVISRASLNMTHNSCLGASPLALAVDLDLLQHGRAEVSDAVHRGEVDDQHDQVRPLEPVVGVGHDLAHLLE